MLDDTLPYSELVKTFRRPNQHGDIVGVSPEQQERMGLHRSLIDDIVEGNVTVSDDLRRLAEQAKADRTTVERTNPHEGSS